MSQRRAKALRRAAQKIPKASKSLWLRIVDIFLGAKYEIRL